MTDDPAPIHRLPDEGWCRLHPLTPVARIGRLVPALVLLFVVSTVHSKAENGRAETDYLVVITLASAVYGYIHWMVTRWRFEGDTLRIETGLIRKDSRRLPLARIQAVDIVRPVLARLLGVSELRIRLAGSGSTDGKLAFLSEAQAAELRLVLLAGHIDAEARRVEQHRPAHGQRGHGSPARVDLPLADHDRVVGTVAALAVLDQFEPKTAAAAAGFLAVYLLSAAGVIWRRLSGQYAFIAVEAPEGVRIRRGLLQTISETVPYARIQAVRQVEPLLWRPFGWCRLEVDVAGATARNQRGEGTGVVRKALLPVGSQQDSWHLLARLLGAPDPERTAPPGAGPLEGAAELSLPVGRPRRRARRLRDGSDQPGDHLGAAGEVPEHPPGAGPAAAPARTGHRPRRRGGEAGAGRVPGPGGGGGGPAGGRADRTEPGGPAARTARAPGVGGRRRPVRLVPGPGRTPRAALLARRPLDRARGRRRAAERRTAPTPAP